MNKSTKVLSIVSSRACQCILINARRMRMRVTVVVSSVAAVAPSVCDKFHLPAKSPLKVFKMQILLKGFLSGVIACFSL